LHGNIKNPGIASFLTEIFLDEQTESQILNRLFHSQVSDKALNFIRANRLRIREQLTESESVPIQPLLNDVGKLVGKYRLVIVSAASEELVSRVLLKHEIGYFSYVFGRNSSRIDHEWREIENKSRLFIRLSAMIGVPLERMIFVGDSDADYRAAKQLSVPFIENTVNARRLGRQSLIKSAIGEHEVISGKKPGELIEKIGKIENAMTSRLQRLRDRRNSSVKSDF
jgi:phosphoglycolate phosphatase-like HAD superfamily hydrolase